MNKLLSILIPTRNRQKYCIGAIKEILSIGSERIEICVQDNSDDNSLEYEIKAIGSSSVIYNYHRGVLSFVDNFSEAITISSGEYLCLIGDDDGILPNIIPAIQYMKENNLDVLVPSLNACYFWPSDTPLYPKAENGYLALTKDRFNIKKIDPILSLDNFVKNGLIDYLSFDMPKLYHGIVKKGVLQEIKNVTGNYFQGLTPDIFMATALCFVAKKFEMVDYPVTIAGICPMSGSSDSATGKHTGDLKDAPHFRGHNNYEWEKLIPPFYSVETIWAETALKCLRMFGKDDIIKKINLPLFYQHCLNKFPQFKDIIFETATLNNINIPENYIVKQENICVRFSRRVINRILNGRPKRFYDVIDITAAKEIIEKNIRIKI